MMTLWSPFSDLMRDDDFWRWPAQSRAHHVPAVDVVEEKDAFVLKAEVPGLSAEQVDVSVDGNLLTIKGEHRQEQKDEKEGYRRIERRYGSFQRSFTLPDTVDAEKVDADMSNGILTVRVPKKDAAQPRRIAVKAGNLIDKARKVLGKENPEKAA